MTLEGTCARVMSLGSDRTSVRTRTSALLHCRFDAPDCASPKPASYGEKAKPSVFVWPAALLCPTTSRYREVSFHLRELLGLRLISVVLLRCCAQWHGRGVRRKCRWSCNQRQQPRALRMRGVTVPGNGQFSEVTKYQAPAPRRRRSSAKLREYIGKINSLYY